MYYVVVGEVFSESLNGPDVSGYVGKTYNLDNLAHPLCNPLPLSTKRRRDEALDDAIVLTQLVVPVISSRSNEDVRHGKV